MCNPWSWCVPYGLSMSSCLSSSYVRSPRTTHVVSSVVPLLPERTSANGSELLCPDRKSRTSNLSISPSAGSPCCCLRSSSYQTSSGSGTPCFLTRSVSTSWSWCAAPCWCECQASAPRPSAALMLFLLWLIWSFLTVCRLIRENLLAGDFTVNMRLLQVQLLRSLHRCFNAS